MKLTPEQRGKLKVLLDDWLDEVEGPNNPGVYWFPDQEQVLDLIKRIEDALE